LHPTQVTCAALALAIGAPLAQAAKPPAATPYGGNTIWQELAEELAGPPTAPGAGGAADGFAEGLEAAADHIVDQQCLDGGWGWPHDDCGTTYNNITGPIALGLLRAHELIGYDLQPSLDAGDFDLTFQYGNGESRFGASAPFFLWRLSQVSGDNQYSNHAESDFFDELQAGTYGPSDLDTAGWIASVEAARTGTWVNLRPWEFDTLAMVSSAAVIGNAGQQALFVQGVLDGLNTLDNTAPASVYSDIIGITGGVRGLALSGTTSFAAINAPNHALVNGLTTLCDLADMLAGLQNPDGSWYWHSDLSSLGGATNGDKDVQTSAYALMALIAAEAAGCGPYDSEIVKAYTWITSMQDVDGGYFSYPGGGHNTEVEGEALNALTMAGAARLTLEIDDCPDDWDANDGNGYQIGVELWMRDLPTNATGFQAFLTFNEAVLTYEGGMSSYTVAPFPLHVQGIAGANVAPGEIRVDGSDNFNGSGTDVDSLLATLVFTVGTECVAESVDFDLTQLFESELSFEGDPIPTNLESTGDVTLDDTPPDITCPDDVLVECVEDADPGLPYGVGTGGVAIYYNDNGGGEVPTNQAYLQAQFSVGDTDTGMPYVFDNTPLTGASTFSFHDLYSGLVWPESQFGIDLILEAPTSIGNPVTPVLNAYDNGDNTVGGRILVGPVSWAINDYKPHAPDIDAGDVLNSMVRSASPGAPGDVVITRNDVTVSVSIYTSVLEGFLVSDGIHHWYTVGQPDSPMANFGLSGVFYFSGTLTYDVNTDVDPLMDFYEGSVTLTANFPSSATGFATATDNCTLFPVIGYSDTDNGGGGCPGDPLIITRTWTATDDCGNVSSCEQTITVIDSTAPTFLTVPDDIEVNADPGGCDATLTLGEIGEPTASDNCDCGVASIVGVRDDGAPNLDDPYDSADSPITITWTATDCCGNEETYDQTIVVNAVTATDVVVVLPGSVPTSRCIHFVTDDCDVTVDVVLDFIDHDANGATPVQATATIDVPCGDWTFLCAKDEQHTQWDTSPLTPGGSGWVATTTLVLVPGDDDNDGDIDINDITLLLVQFGAPEPFGDCPWNGLRGSDFDNGGDVDSTDYSLLTANWLTVSSCGCTTAQTGPLAGPKLSVKTSDLDPWMTTADLNRDGRVDVGDVIQFEQLHNLNGALSKKMRRVQRQLRSN
jgi:hypothetical protein